MSLVVLLFAAGLVLLALEVVVPGGILGVAGGIAVVAGVIVAFLRLGTTGGLVSSAAALVVGCVMLYVEFVFLPKSRFARTLSMTATVDGTSQPPIADRAVIGRQVTAVTPLSPSGYVELAGKRYEAFARTGHARVGECLDVVDLDNFRLIVSKSTPRVS